MYAVAKIKSSLEVRNSIVENQISRTEDKLEKQSQNVQQINEMLEKINLDNENLK